MAPDEPRARRLHPVSLPLDLLRRGAQLGVYAFAIVFLSARSDEAWYLLFLLPPLVGAVLRYVSFRYELGGDALFVREGLFVREQRQVPYARIQSLDTTQNPLQRLLRVVEVRVQTAAGKEPEAHFRVISNGQLEELRAAVLGARGTLERSPERDAAFFRMRAGDIAVFGLLSQRWFVALLGLFAIARQFGDEERVEELGESAARSLLESTGGLGPLAWVALVLAVLGVTQLLSVVWAFVKLHDLRIEERGEALHTSFGLLTRRSATVPRSRIQSLRVRRGLFQRALFGRASVSVASAGGGGGEAGEGRTHSALVPACAEPEVARLLERIQPEADFARARWRGVHPRARRRLAFRRSLRYAPLALLAWLASPWLVPAALAAILALAWLLAGPSVRALGWATSERAFFLRRGFTAREQVCVRYEKIQSVGLTRTCFDRRAGMATVSIDTAGSGAFAVPLLPLRDAARLARHLARRAAGTEFRW